MSEQNKHHHRKSKSDKSANRGSDDNQRSEEMHASKQPSQSSAPNEEDSKLHFADATMQTPGEHATDEKTDPSLNDKTTATP